MMGITLILASGPFTEKQFVLTCVQGISYLSPPTELGAEIIIKTRLNFNIAELPKPSG